MLNSILGDPTRRARAIGSGARKARSLAALVWAIGVVTIHGQTPSTSDVRGEWRSSEQFENEPRVTLIVRDDGAVPAGSLTVRGMTRGADDRAILRTQFREGKWNGTTLTFETVLPDDEGKAAWVLRVTAAGKATLHTSAEDGKPDADGPSWEMRRQ